MPSQGNCLKDKEYFTGLTLFEPVTAPTDSTPKKFQNLIALKIVDTEMSLLIGLTSKDPPPASQQRR